MKKALLTIALVMTLVLTGCGAEQEKTMTCKRTAKQDGYEMELNYTVTYKGKYVTVLKSEEKIISDSKELLEAYKSQVESLYAPYKDVKHYEYDVKIDGNTLTSTVTADYSKIDTDKMIEIDSANSQLIKDGKVAIEDVESLYSAVGATCEK